MRPVARALVLTLGLGACRGDSRPPPPMTVIEPLPAAGRVEARPNGGVDAGWWSTPLGEEAVAARTRGDRAHTIAVLDRLLADDSLPERERAAAEWLRAMEDMHERNFHSAAARLARANRAAGLAPVAYDVKLAQAEAHLACGEPDRALALLDESSSDPPSSLAGSVLLTRADALARTGQHKEAIEVYQTFLDRHGKTRRRVEAKSKLATLLAHSPGFSDARRARELFEQILFESPVGVYAEQAASELESLRSERVSPAALREFELARVEALLDRREYVKVVKEVDALLRRPGSTAATRCKALFAFGTATFRQRKRAKSVPMFERAAQACKLAGPDLVDLQVKAQYQAARGRFADGNHETAARAFESLAKQHPNHSYADDAWVLAGESWAEANMFDRSRSAYERALAEHPNGDMGAEACRRLVVESFVSGDVAGTLKQVDAGLARGNLRSRERCKLWYLKGRALAKTGDPSGAVHAWMEAVESCPLAYGSLLAMSRLREQGEGELAQAIALLDGDRVATSEPPLTLPSSQAAARARVLAQLGFVEEAESALADANVDGWPAVALMAQAGFHTVAQRLLTRIPDDWRDRGPGSFRRAWELAHPLAFSELVETAQANHSIPTLVLSAIMQTESKFDPRAVSSAGARGLIQLMPATARHIAQEAQLSADPERLFDPAVNIDLGTRYFTRLVRRFGGGESAVALAVASYNAGAGNVERWIDRSAGLELDLFVETIPFDETREYTQAVLGRWFAYRWLYGEGTPAARVPHVPLSMPSRHGPAMEPGL